ESKASLLAYFELVDHEAAQNYEEKLKAATNDNLYDLTEAELKNIDESIVDIKDDLEKNADKYIETLSESMYETALQHANVLGQRVDLSLHEDEYANKRDQYLAESLESINGFVAHKGHDKVCVTGHNGHIEKTSAAFGYKSMGDYLDETFWDSYFAIGTESARNMFLADNGDGERETFTVKNNSSLTKAFGNVDADRIDVEFEQAETNEDLDDIISSKQ